MRARDVQFALTSNHLGFTTDGTFRYGAELDEAVDEGTVAFVMAPEHLGVREILPSAPGGPLEFTGAGEVFAWSAPEESPVLVAATIAAVERRDLDRTAVLKGVGAPSADQGGPQHLLAGRPRLELPLPAHPHHRRDQRAMVAGPEPVDAPPAL